MKGLDGLKVVQVECGGMHTVALTSDGKVRLYMFLYGAYYTEDHLQFLNYWRSRGSETYLLVWPKQGCAAEQGMFFGVLSLINNYSMSVRWI